MSHDRSTRALQELRRQLEEAIDGGEECRGRDSQISRWIELCDIALGNPIEPWAWKYHAESIGEK